jgi:osmotically inducible protein OsmC
MAFANELSKAGFKPDSVETSASVNLENVPSSGWTVTSIHLETRAKVPGITPEKFAEVAAGAKVGCPISRLLKAAEITLDAKLV